MVKVAITSQELIVLLSPQCFLLLALQGLFQFPWPRCPAPFYWYKRINNRALVFTGAAQPLGCGSKTHKQTLKTAKPPHLLKSIFLDAFDLGQVGKKAKGLWENYDCSAFLGGTAASLRVAVPLMAPLCQRVSDHQGIYPKARMSVE